MEENLEAQQPKTLIEKALSLNNRHPRFKRFQELFLYFWVISVLGHYLEELWVALAIDPQWHPVMSTFLPLAPPYGLGAVAIVLFVAPLKKKYKMGPLVIFLISAFVSALVEYLCGVVISMFLGSNPFWDYSHSFMNIQGYTCLESALLLGVLATLFVYFVYPSIEKLLQKIGEKRILIIFLILFITYAIDVVCMFLS